MDDILFLTHRIPYPPNKGEKIRAWNILSHLAEQYRVHLGTFVDAAEDIRHLERLQTICASVFWRPLVPCLAVLHGFSSLLRGASLTRGYFGNPSFKRAVDRALDKYNPSFVYVFSSAMAPYVMERRGTRVILDMVDVDSEKWRQYAEDGHWPARWIYAREGRALLTLERRAAIHADAVMFVTPAEVNLFNRLVPEAAGRIHCIGNGVDSTFFCPRRIFSNPVGDRPAIVFTGVMSYRPNIEAMVWFVEQVMPLLRQNLNSPCLWIVGSEPTKAVRALAGPDVRVTGRVPDVRPYLNYASVVVAPLHIARGIQNKVLEAMAMGAAVVVTPQIRETLDRCKGNELATAATPAEFADAISRVLMGDIAAEIGALARERVVRDYRWDRSLEALDRLIKGTPDELGADAYTEASDSFRLNEICQ